MPRQKIKGVIFDLGNTLMYLDGDSEEIVRQEIARLRAFLKKAGVNLDSTAFTEAFLQQRVLLYQKAEREWREHPASEVLTRVLAQFGWRDVNPELIKEAVAVFFSPEEKLWQAYPDAEVTLQELSERGYRLGLISNASDDGFIQRVVDRLGFRRWLCPVLSSAGVGIRKPNPQIFLMILDQWRLSPSQAVMVGDQLKFDVLGARLTGMPSVWINRGEDPYQTDQGQELTPDFEIESLSELPEVLSRI